MDLSVRTANKTLQDMRRVLQKIYSISNMIKTAQDIYFIRNKMQFLKTNTEYNT